MPGIGTRLNICCFLVHGLVLPAKNEWGNKRSVANDREGMQWKSNKMFISIFFFFSFKCRLTVPDVSWGMQDLVPWAGIDSRPPALGVWNLSQWTTRQVLISIILMKMETAPVFWVPHPVSVLHFPEWLLCTHPQELCWLQLKLWKMGLFTILRMSSIFAA